MINRVSSVMYKAQIAAFVLGVTMLYCWWDPELFSWGFVRNLCTFWILSLAAFLTLVTPIFDKFVMRSLQSFILAFVQLLFTIYDAWQYTIKHIINESRFVFRPTHEDDIDEDELASMMPNSNNK